METKLIPLPMRSNTFPTSAMTTTELIRFCDYDPNPIVQLLVKELDVVCSLVPKDYRDDLSGFLCRESSEYSDDAYSLARAEEDLDDAKEELKQLKDKYDALRYQVDNDGRKQLVAEAQANAMRSSEKCKYAVIERDNAKSELYVMTRENEVLKQQLEMWTILNKPAKDFRNR